VKFSNTIQLSPKYHYQANSVKTNIKFWLDDAEILDVLAYLKTFLLLPTTSILVRGTILIMSKSYYLGKGDQPRTIFKFFLLKKVCFTKLTKSKEIW